MNTYYLRNPKEEPIHVLDNPYGSSHCITVKGGDWYEARLRAFDHAATTGARHCLIVVGHCVPQQVGSGSGERSLATLTAYTPSNHTDHGLLVYLRRLLGQYAGAVQVPPVGVLPQLPRGWAEQVPVIPMVSAYSVAAVKSIDASGPTLGYNLVSTGYRVLTLGDYGFTQHGPVVLDEWGTAKKWKQSYEQCLKSFL